MNTENNDLLPNIFSRVWKSIVSLWCSITDTFNYWVLDYIFPTPYDSKKSYAVNPEKISLMGSNGKQFSLVVAYFTLSFFLMLAAQISYRVSKPFHKIENKESNLLMLYLAVIPYGIPFLEAFNNFGKYTMPHLPVDLQLFYNEYIRPVLEGSYIDFNTFYVILLFSQYVIFIQPKRLHKFTRYHMLHSILVYLITSLLGIIYWSLPDNFTQNLYGELTCDLCLLICMSMIAHAFVKALFGQYCQIPVVSEAVRIHLEGY